MNAFCFAFTWLVLFVFVVPADAEELTGSILTAGAYVLSPLIQGLIAWQGAKKQEVENKRVESAGLALRGQEMAEDSRRFNINTAMSKRQLKNQEAATERTFKNQEAATERTFKNQEADAKYNKVMSTVSMLMQQFASSNNLRNNMINIQQSRRAV